MGLLRLLISAPQLFLLLVVPLLYSVIAHETAHGWCALAFGDDTAKRYGRLTLNPLAHLDPVGTFLLFVVGFGWAKPVPVNYAHLRNSRVGVFCVALAGCATNILIAIAAIALQRSPLVGANSLVAVLLAVVAKINIILAAFNLLPIPPLDGSKILFSFLPLEAQRGFARLQRYGLPLLMLLLFTGWLDPVIGAVERLIASLINALIKPA